MANPDPILTQLATARRLSSGLPAGVRMLQALGLNRHEQAGLLGLNPRSLERAAHPSAPVLVLAQLARLSITIGIYNALHLLYDANTAAGWLQRANQRPPFGGQTPLDYMRRGGVPAMDETRRLLAGDQGGLFSVTPKAHRAAADFRTVIEL
ncbi:antitoxin Xre/MbcA/ParS toxin-binding domain-containing protein [Deinococcus humi]|uniref:Antitoxin Xre/MbcA/ParS-like toxin-binding domain-containing protein n=1 Tax=Deinococcus humi TaxID=662880 RepID=A0A7W8NIA5_9DEIO|nr:antitoxin Xre/MbcA/ParS toxin-binding domain-containing protein [Deinococcus humi]MBB5364847.1 hypothetical protein [Deinococcus humi]GGO33914.1 hypothetical protein GCM10008949_33890 [Deinococcus humi]